MLVSLLCATTLAHSLPRCDVARVGAACYTDVGQRVLWPAVCPGPPLDDAALQPPVVLNLTPPGHFGYDFVGGCKPDLSARNLTWCVA